MQPDIENWFTYHSPTESQAVRYQKIRDAAKYLAQTINECCPDCADRTAAFRQLRENCDDCKPVPSRVMNLPASN